MERTSVAERAGRERAGSVVTTASSDKEDKLGLNMQS